MALKQSCAAVVNFVQDVGGGNAILYVALALSLAGVMRWGFGRRVHSVVALIQACAAMIYL